jgi:probable addiction module antidote protein
VALETIPWDPADHLKTKEDVVAYLDAVLEDGDIELLKAALGDIARSEEMAMIAKEAQLSRTSLYRSLSQEVDPKLSTVMNILKAMGLRFSAAAI